MSPTPALPSSLYRAYLRHRQAPFRYAPTRHPKAMPWTDQATHWQVGHRGEWHRVWVAARRPHLYVVIRRQVVPVRFERRSER